MHRLAAITLALFVLFGSAGALAQEDKKRPQPKPNDERIYGGTVIDNNVYRFLVAIVYSGTVTVTCGGSIIDHNTVLTAAHCVTEVDAQGQPTTTPIAPSSIEIRAFDTDVRFGTVFPVQRISVHPNYMSNNGHSHDAALVHVVDWSFYPADEIGLAAYATSAPYAANQPQRIMGWGDTEAPGDDFPDTARQTTVRVWSDADVQARPYYGQFIPNQNYGMNNTNPARDACIGDSGGPAIWKKADGTWIQAGIVSWGNGCGYGGSPGVYVEIAAPTIRNFITNYINA